ncbi:MAG: SpoIIE family protein phosphatase [Spirochaetales bacterium]|nr:SpoIIE family protein phosphatase [Spirochaetales bacterium]
MKKYKVIIVDDDKGVLHALKREIKSFSNLTHLDFYFFETPQSVFDFLKYNKDIALVITDQRMPVMSGEQLLLKMRKSNPDCSAILLSAYSDIDAISKSVGAGLVSFLQKPWNSTYLMNEIIRGVDVFKMKQIMKQYIRDVNRELRSCGKFQKSLMKKGLPKHEQLDFTVRSICQPHQYSSSDIYKIIKIDRNRFLYFLADGDGPGFKAASKTFILWTLLNEILMETDNPGTLSPGNLLKILNSKIYQHIGHLNNETVQCCAFMLDLEFMTITSAGGGRIVPLILRSANVFSIEVSGPALGIHEDFDYEESMSGILPDDRIVMYTDGLSDLQEQYGVVHRYMREHCMKQSFTDDVMDALKKLLNNKPASDDMTLMAVQVKTTA